MQINLVATQLTLDREHANRLLFDGQEGMDPQVCSSRPTLFPHPSAHRERITQQGTVSLALPWQFAHEFMH